MDDLSTTREACDPVKGCPCSCDRGWAEVQDEVNQALRSPDPFVRNQKITEAYGRLAARDPKNLWVRLASYVSMQGGCAMRTSQSALAQSLGRPLLNPAEALDALQDANRTIFSSIYPVVHFAQKCGVKKLRECSESGSPRVAPQLLDALDELERGNLQRASDMIAEYEQRVVVQQVYVRHAETFDDMMTADAWAPGDYTSIPVAKTCTRDDLVSIEGLDIRKPLDRVKYYQRLIKRMLSIRHGASGSW